MAIKKRPKLVKVDTQSVFGGKIAFKDRKFKLSEKQQKVLECLMDDKTKVVFISGVAGSSKAQPLDAQVVTPEGFIKMGDIKVGDTVCTPDGSTASVSGVFPQGEIDVYRVSFSDGTSTECCGDHLWMTQTAKDRSARGKKGGRTFKRPREGSIKTTLQIKDSVLYSTDLRLNHSIPITNPVAFQQSQHVIHPYILGVLLGDGCTLQSVRFTSADRDIADKVASHLPSDMSISNREEIEYCIIDDQASWKTPNRFKTELKRLGAFGHKAHEKFIPQEYLVDSVDNRIQLLRGLMDTDGHVTDSRGRSGNSVYFSTTSSRLCEDVRFLVESLGGTMSISLRQNYFTYLGVKKQGLDSFSLCIRFPADINPFSLSRKAEKVIPKTKYPPMRFVTAVELVGKKECQCILLDDENHLYMTNNFIVTHNTYLSVYAALNLLNRDYNYDIIYLRSIIESASKSLGYLPGSSEDKFSPFMIPLLEKCDEILDDHSTKELVSSEKLTSLPINFLRGVDWKNKIVIVDESQNLNLKELTTVLTRVGENTKVFLVGDKDQSDINGKSGFGDFITAFSTPECVENGIHSFEFGEEDIVRSEILKLIVRRIATIVPHK